MQRMRMHLLEKMDINQLILLVIYGILSYIFKTSYLYINVVVKLSIFCFSTYLLYLTTTNINYALNQNILDNTNLNLYYGLCLILFIFLANNFFTLFD